jgi:hypothetical protein
MTTDLILKSTDLYNSSKHKNMLESILDIYIPFNKTVKSIAITLSGGADSSLLTFMLCDIIEKNRLDITVHIITSIRMWKLRPWQEYVSLTVYNYFLNKFPNIKFCRHTNFVPPEFEWGSVGPSIKDEYGKINSGDIIELRAFSEYILFKHDIKMWYSAVNKNPTDVNDGPAERNISEITLEQLIKEKENDLYLCKPFLFLEKDWIINAYKKLKILDLFEITRSCEGDKNTAPEIFNNLDYTNYDWGMYVPECNSCFWCKERQWGLKYGK